MHAKWPRASPLSQLENLAFVFLLNPWIYYGKILASTLKYGLENPKNIKNSIAAYIKQINDNNLITFIYLSQ